MKGLNPIQYKSKVSASPPSPDLKVREAVDDRPVTSESLVREQRFIPVQYWPVVVRPGQRADVYKITGRQLVAEKDSFFYYYYSFNVLRKAGEATEKARGYLDRREDSLCTWKKGKAMQGKAEGRGHVDGAHRVVGEKDKTMENEREREREREYIYIYICTQHRSMIAALRKSMFGPRRQETVQTCSQGRMDRYSWS